MVNSKNNYVERLINLGMNEREAKVYLALLKTPNATASDLQKNSGLRQNKIYEIIGNLVRQGYCSERQEGRIRTYESLDPQTVLKEPILTLQTRLSDSIKLQKELHDLYNAAEKNIEPFEYIEVIHGNESIHKKFVTLLNEAENEILNFVRPPFAAHSLEMYEEQNEAYNRFLDKG
nr:TrmB family transcriptional regulator [Deltaproteobacteria bacterium]